MEKFIFATVLILKLISLSNCQTCPPHNERIDCHPGPFSDMTDQETQCEAKGCYYCRTNEGVNAPWCVLPENYGYIYDTPPAQTENGWNVALRRTTSTSYFGNDSFSITIQAYFESDYRLRIKIWDELKVNPPRFEVPIEIYPPSTGNFNRMYNMVFSNSPFFSFKIIRNTTGTVIFDTSTGGLTFSEQFLQISSRLPSSNFYGLGEQEHSSYKHSTVGYPVWSIYTRDHPPLGRANLYGSHPYYIVREDDGNTHSVAFINSNAQEFVLLPNPGILYRTIGGILDMYFFLGPSPENVAQQYSEAVGRQRIPPYWALGFHLSRWGYNSIETMRDTLDRNVKAGIPVDVQHGNIDIMDQKMDFTYSPNRFNGLPEFVKEIKAQGIKFVTVLNPFIAIDQDDYRPFDLGEEMSVWVRRHDGIPVIGRGWPGDSTWPVHYPDYSRPSAKEWWKILLREFHDLIEYDGLMIVIGISVDVEIILSICHHKLQVNKFQNFERLQKSVKCILEIVHGSLYDKTLCPDHVAFAGKLYDTHSLYGWFNSEATNEGIKAALGKRPFVLSRSTFLGSGKWVNHWLGDNFSNWNYMYYSIIGMLEFNHFGIPFVGADICGFSGDSTKELCQRWQQLGAFYPFSRNHNMITEQDPAFWGQEVIDSTIKALNVRYTLLPYLYTLFYHHYTNGYTVIRALWHEFTNDKDTWEIDRQFMWGPGLLISPVLEQGVDRVEAYFPDSRFYNYYNGAEISVRNSSTILDAPLDGDIPVHVRGGHILPTQRPGPNTHTSRNSPFGLIVALDDNGNAFGNLYFDDGDSLDPVENRVYFYATYRASNRSINTTIHQNGYSEMSSKYIGDLRLFGASNVNQVTVNGVDHPFVPSPEGETTIKNLFLPPNQPFVITF